MAHDIFRLIVAFLLLPAIPRALAGCNNDCSQCKSPREAMRCATNVSKRQATLDESFRSCDWLLPVRLNRSLPGCRGAELYTAECPSYAFPYGAPKNVSVPKPPPPYYVEASLKNHGGLKAWLSWGSPTINSDITHTRIQVYAHPNNNIGVGGSFCLLVPGDRSSCVISSEDIQGTVIGGWKPTYLYKVSISVFPLKDCSTNPLFTGTNMTWHSKCGSDECLPNPPAPANVDFMTMKEDSTGKMDVNVTWTIGKTKAPIIKSIVYVFWPSPSEGVTHCHTDKNPKQTWCFIRSLPSHLVFTARVKSYIDPTKAMDNVGSSDYSHLIKISLLPKSTPIVIASHSYATSLPVKLRTSHQSTAPVTQKPSHHISESQSSPTSSQSSPTSSQNGGKSNFPENVILSCVAGLVAVAVIAVACTRKCKKKNGEHDRSELVPRHNEIHNSDIHNSDIFVLYAGTPKFSETARKFIGHLRTYHGIRAFSDEYQADVTNGKPIMDYVSETLKDVDRVIVICNRDLFEQWEQVTKDSPCYSRESLMNAFILFLKFSSSVWRKCVAVVLCDKDIRYVPLLFDSSITFKWTREASEEEKDRLVAFLRRSEHFQSCPVNPRTSDKLNECDSDSCSV